MHAAGITKLTLLGSALITKRRVDGLSRIVNGWLDGCMESLLDTYIGTVVYNVTEKTFYGGYRNENMFIDDSESMPNNAQTACRRSLLFYTILIYYNRHIV